MSQANKSSSFLPLIEKKKFQPQDFIHSSLFSDVYILNDLPIRHKGLWDRIEDGGKYDQFFTHLVTLMDSFTQKNAYDWNHSETLNNLIYPLLEILGYGDHSSKHHPYLENQSMSFLDSTGSQVDIRVPLMICEDEQGKKYIKDANKSSIIAECKKYLKIPVVTSYYGSCFDRKSNKYDFKKDEIGKRGDVFSNLGPNNQVLEYLQILDSTWGIYTDGAVWRLFRKDASSIDAEKCYEFDFSLLFNLYRTSNDHANDEHSEFFEIAKYFYWFFSYESIVKGTTVVPFIETIYRDSQTYVENIDEDLKERFVHAMTIACNGYLNNISLKHREESLRLISKTAESFVFNLIFIRSCESRRVLPVHQDYIHISLKALIDKVRYFSYSEDVVTTTNFVKQGLKDIFGKVIKGDGHEIYEYIVKLHGNIEKGHNGFGVTGFVESIFYPEEKAFYKENKIQNDDMINLMYQLFYTVVEGKNVQIPYSLVTPRQLGSIYESFLEFQPALTDIKMYYVKTKSKGQTSWQWVDESLVPKNKRIFCASVDKGGMLFSPNNEERKTTGSYYTNDVLVNHLVKEAIAPLCEGRSVPEILKLKFADLTMGSGHFLLGVIDFVAKKICEKDGQLDLSSVKRMVLDSCIFGSDINPSAVKLAKMSLWLTTALPGKKLERLDDQMVICNSVYFGKKGFKLRKGEKFFKTLEEGFDAIVTNPPWETLKINDDEFFNSHFVGVSKNTRRKDKLKMREEILKKNPDLNREYQEYKKSIEEVRKVVDQNLSYQKVSSENFSTGMAEDNLYKIFLEISLASVKEDGFLGILIPSGILGDIGTINLRKHILDHNRLKTVVSFRKDSKIFENVTQSCCMLTIRRGGHTNEFKCLSEVSSIKDFQARVGGMSISESSMSKNISSELIPIIDTSGSFEISIFKKLFSNPKVMDYSLRDVALVPKCGSNTTYLSELYASKKTAHPVAKGEDLHRYQFDKKSDGYLEPKSLIGKKRVDQGLKVGVGLISGTTDIRRMRSAIIPSGAWPVNSINYFDMEPFEDKEEFAYFLMSVLNSCSVEFFIRKFCQNNNINVFALKHIPVPQFDKNNSVHKKIIKLAKKCEVDYSRNSELELDKLIAEAFGLSLSEHQYILDAFFKDYWS